MHIDKVVLRPVTILSVVSVTSSALTAWAAFYLTKEYAGAFSYRCGTPGAMIANTMSFDVQIGLAISILSTLAAIKVGGSTPLVRIAPWIASGTVALGWSFIAWFPK